MATRAIACVCVAFLALTSCSGPADDNPDLHRRIGSVAQTLTDTDSDGMDDDWETLHFGNLSQTAAGDFDADGMTNGEEHQYGFNPTVDDSFEDADGDRYPNVFEIRGGADPNVSTSVPAATYTVNPVNVIDSSGQGPVDCAKAVAEYLRVKAKLDQRLKEATNPDKGHLKAIEQLRNKLRDAEDKVRRHCKDGGTLLAIGFLACVVVVVTAPIVGAPAAAL